MRTRKTITFTVELSDDFENDPITPSDLFYFEQALSGLPTIYRHQGRRGEQWDGFTSSITGEKSYLKIVGIEGLLLRTFCVNDESMLNKGKKVQASVATDDDSSNTDDPIKI